MRSLQIFFAVLLVFSTCSAASADRGMIVPGMASAYEPGQKAIVAWNGEQEVMILSTNVYASENTWALEVLSLPSQPDVKEGSFDSFFAIQDILSAYAMKAYARRGLEGGAPLEVVFHEQIGAHDVFVVRAVDAHELIYWAENSLGAKIQGISWSGLRNLAAAYIRRGMEYWVFDLVDLSDQLKSREPIIYSFKSRSLYYPLEISSLASGETEITLFALTSDKLRMRSAEEVGFRVRSFEVGRENIPLEFEVSEGELQRISEEVAGLFDGKAWLSVLTYDGSLMNLSGDLILSAAPEPTEPLEPNRTLVAWLTAALIAALILFFTAVYKVSPRE